MLHLNTDSAVTIRYGKTERLGIIPAEKIPTVVGAKVWAEHRKNLAALAAAKAAAGVSKAAVQTAIAKSGSDANSGDGA